MSREHAPVNTVEVRTLYPDTNQSFPLGNFTWSEMDHLWQELQEYSPRLITTAGGNYELDRCELRGSTFYFIFEPVDLEGEKGQ